MLIRTNASIATEKVTTYLSAKMTQFAGSVERADTEALTVLIVQAVGIKTVAPRGERVGVEIAKAPDTIAAQQRELPEESRKDPKVTILGTILLRAAQNLAQDGS